MKIRFLANFELWNYFFIYPFSSINCSIHISIDKALLQIKVRTELNFDYYTPEPLYVKDILICYIK